MSLREKRDETLLLCPPAGSFGHDACEKKRGAFALAVIGLLDLFQFNVYYIHTAFIAN